MKLQELAPTPAWMRHARCRDHDPELFFPGFGESARDRRDRERRAIAMCELCPVLASCRDFARAQLEVGIWGGENDAERRSAVRAGRMHDAVAPLRAAR